MSKYLETTGDLLTPEVLFNSLYRYVLDELTPVTRELIEKHLPPIRMFIWDNGKKIIQKILDDSNHQLRMYGTAEEVTENLKIFRDFPFAHEFFLADQFLYSKDDRISIFIMLKEYTAKYSSSLEFVKFDEKWFEEIEKKMREADKICPVYEFDFAQIRRQLTAGNFTEIISIIPRFDSKPRTKANEVFLSTFLETYCEDVGPIGPAEQINQFFTFAIRFEAMATIIETNSEIFFKNSVMAVRVFEDGSQRFVMKAELFNAISNSLGNKFKKETNLFSTIPMEEVERIYGHRVKNIEFLRTPIIRTKHRAVPVKGMITGEYGILAIDTFFEYFRNMLIGQKFFQKYNKPDWDVLSEMFEVFFDVIYKIDSKTPYFVRHAAPIPDISNIFNTIKTIPAKDIRNAKIDGFTVQNLKNELIHLGLTNAFPEIVNHAEAVYSAVDRLKKGKYLSTSDLFEAVFHSQLICIIDRIPKFKTFLHNQSGCGRVLGYFCELCQKASDDQKSSDQKSINSSDKTEKKTLKSSEQQKSLESSENKNKSLSLKEFEEMKQKILELEEKNHQLNEQNMKLLQEVKELKLKKLSIDSENPSTNFSVISTETPRCEICDSELDTTGETKKCPMCRTRFHSKCAIEYIKHEIKCPSCKGTLRNSMITPKFS
uniref:RING-type domain-containing protein n=1 Tax=Caenorhabditis tropicalis TaxID=1561998 RepID=A0A1I7TGS2_9PELO